LRNTAYTFYPNLLRMRRANNLLPLIADSDNLRLAVWKAAKGKRYSAEVLDYQNNLDKNLQHLHDQIRNSKVVVGDYRYFTIYEPKERQICASAFREQVLHHALMNVCHPDRVNRGGSWNNEPQNCRAAVRNNNTPTNRNNNIGFRLALSF